eukprot:2646850-Pleurochrysis_carterae.AAC.1
MEGEKEHLQKSTKWSGIGSCYEFKGESGKGDLHVDTVTRRDSTQYNSGQHSSPRTGGSAGRDGYRID